MLINLTNHPYAQWAEEQKAAAAEYGECVDWPFPPVSPELSEEAVNTMAAEIVSSVLSQYGERESLTIHLMGEFTLTYALINLFKASSITCIASCSCRNVIPANDNTKIVAFNFVRFRKYI